MKALYILTLALSFCTMQNIHAADQFRPFPDTISVQPYVKTIKGTTQTVQVYNGTGYNTYKIFNDGFSRPIQKHAIGASPKGKDVISFTIYDCMGREDSVTFLPYVKDGNGRLISSPVLQQALFYKRTMGYSVDGDYAFSRKKYAKTPYEQVELTDAPGRYHNSLSPIAHPVTHSIRRNQPNGDMCPDYDKVSKYKVISDSMLVYVGSYAEGQLLVNQSCLKFTDTETKVSLEYTDAQGRKVADGELINDSLLRLTHYVYDEIGNLRYMIPAVEDKKIRQKLSGKHSYAPHELAYSVYHGYDKYGNRIILKNPDQACVQYIYDAKHRVILSQDGNQRVKQQWTYFEYDEFNRVLRKSTIYANTDPELLRYWFDDKYGWEVSDLIELKFTGKRLIEQNQYTGYEERIRFNIYDPIFPDDPLREYVRFTVPDYLAYRRIPILQMPYPPTDNPGALCYQKTAILSDDPADSLSYIERAFYYDNKGRNIQSVIFNHLGGISRISNRYDFMGNVIASHESRACSPTASADVRIVYSAYDAYGRLMAKQTKINDSKEATTRYKYDELGRCIQIIYGDSVLTTNYSYDIAGRQILQDNEAFTMEIRYENPSWTKEAKPQYGGLISECSWLNKKVLGGPAQTYAYQYTPFGQLAGAVHYEGTVKRDKFTEQGITYDENDNLLTLQRFEDAQMISNHCYEYTGNALSRLTDMGKESTFNYDLGGNVVYDGRKRCNYQYNILNLLQRATDQAGNLLAGYSYLADGTKLSVRDQAGNGYTYLGSLIYQSNRGRLTLEGTHFDGGRIVKTSTGYEIVYYVTDYLGSVRAVVDSSGKVREYNNYYPFGGRWQDMGPRFAGNRSQFNGKELQVTGQLGLLDYGARMYDPALARWQGCDPAMQFANPFVFCANNPTAYIDKDGQFAWWLVGMGAMLGGYMGGSAANNNWNPFQWNWGSEKTWGGFFGGAMQGALQGLFSIYSYTYGLSVFSSPKATVWGKVLRGTVFSLNTLKIVGTGASLINDFDNGMDIIRGNFLYQGDSFTEKINGGLSRGSWEYPQQFAGNFLSHGRNGFRRNMEVSYFHGATVINRPISSKYRGVTLGNMINGWQLQRDNSAMLYHEYGHVIQSRSMGPVYLPTGLLSLVAALRHDNGYWTEVHANRLAKNYFGADLWNETAGNMIDGETGELKYPTAY